jgi:hypothetical protein
MDDDAFEPEDNGPTDDEIELMEIRRLIEQAEEREIERQIRQAEIDELIARAEEMDLPND